MSESLRGRPEGGRFGLGPLLLALVLSVLWFLALRPAVDPDYGWHVENGRRVLDGTAFSGRDLYSWTATGEWIVHQWLTDAGMSIVHDSMGASANSILAAILWAGGFLLVAIRLRSRGFGWPSTLLTVILGFFCTMMSAGVRPQVLELVYLAVILLFVDRHVEGSIGSRGFFALSVLLAVVWVNTHGSFPLLMVVLALLAAGSFADGTPLWRVFGAAAVAAAIASLANPWGWNIVRFATQSVMSEPTLALIDEWKRPQLWSISLIPFDIAVALAGIAALVAVFRFVRHGGEAPTRYSARPSSGDILVFGAVLYLALTSGRHVMLFGVAAAPLIAWTLSQGEKKLWSSTRRRSAESVPGRADERARSRINLSAAVIVAAVVAIAGWEVVNPAAQAEAVRARYPVGVANSLRGRVGPPEKMFNEYAWGGFLIANGVTPVFIDGRSELYGDDQLVRYSRIIRLSAGWREELDGLGITIAVLPRGSRLAARLAESGWSVAAIDDVGVALQRPR